MKQVVIEKFGGPEVLKVVEVPTPEPGPDQVRIKVTSIGMNHAELMARRGEYKLASGDPPLVPGLECGGVIEAAGDRAGREVGQRVIVGLDAPRAAADQTSGGAYRSHYLCLGSQAVPAPETIPDEQLGAIWLPYLTAWGCLAWRQNLAPGQVVALPAASSSVSLAAAQIVKELGGTAIGLTRTDEKAQRIKQLEQARYDHIVVTHHGEKIRSFHDDLKKLTDGHGVDVFFDPVAAGEYVNEELKALAQSGTIWLYGLLGEPAPVNLHVLIRKLGAAIRGWMVYETALAGEDIVKQAYEHILERFADGTYSQHVDRIFKLDDAVQAHDYMERGKHLGKLVLQP